MVFGELGVGSPGAQVEREGGEEGLRLAVSVTQWTAATVKAAGVAWSGTERRTGSDWSGVDAR